MKPNTETVKRILFLNYILLLKKLLKLNTGFIF